MFLLMLMPAPRSWERRRG